MDDSTDIYMDLKPGTGLNGGKYVIENKIGEGGFSITYIAVQKGLNRAVCIKEYFLAGRCVRNTQTHTVQLQGISEDLFEKYRAAFVREAQTLAALHHPGVVEVIDIFDENNTSYMVMPFIEGRSLQQIVEKNGPLAYPDAVNYVMQIANAVEYIHNRNILHRDIKPDNIMITADFRAILIDFGSAREFQHDKTQRHTSMLTHGYAPPEQYTANSRKGSYTDIYALGASLYFILTGHVPTEAAARLTESFPEPKRFNVEIPDAINRTILKAMQLKAENRHQTVREFMDDLRNVRPSKLVDESPVRSEDKGGHKNVNRLVVILVFAIVLLGVGVTVFEISAHKKRSIQHEMDIRAMDSTYNLVVNAFDNELIKIDEFEKNNLSDLENFKGAFFYLKEIESKENDPLFMELGAESCFKKKFELYRNQIVKRRDAISLNIDKLMNVDKIKADDYFIILLQNRQTLLNQLLEQMKGGSLKEAVWPES